MDDIISVWCRQRLRTGYQGYPAGHGQTMASWQPRGIAVGVSLLLFALVATAAYGQRLTLTPSLAVGERYDDNIFQSQSNETDDFITVLSPGIRVQYLSPAPTPDTRLDFDYRADVEFFAEHTTQNQVAHRGSLTFTSQLTPSLAVRLRDLLVVTEDPFERNERLDDPTGLRPASQQQRARTLRNNARGSLDARLGSRIALGVLFESLIEDVDIPGEVDEYRYTVGTELGYVVNVARDSRILVAYQVTFHTFGDNGGNLPERQTAAFQVHAITAGWRHEFTPTLAISTALGYSFVNADLAQNDDLDAIVANVSLSKTFANGQASLGYVRHIVSGEGEGGVVLADTVSAMAAINLTGKLTARLDGNVSWFSFMGATLGGNDRVFWSVRPGLTYQILRPWRIAVAYAYEYTNLTDQGAVLSSADFADHRLLVGTQFAVRDWLMLGLSYRYAARQVHGDIAVGDTTDFARNQVMLTLTASPSFRF